MSRFIRIGVALLCATFAFWVALTILGNSFFGSLDNQKIMAVGTPERQYFYSHIGWVIAMSFAAMPVNWILARQSTHEAANDPVWKGGRRVRLGDLRSNPGLPVTSLLSTRNARI